MIDFRSNKFYRSPGWHILLYERIPSNTFEISYARSMQMYAREDCIKWSNILKMNVSYVEPNTLLYVLGTYYIADGAVQVIAGEKAGWIWPRRWMEIEEVLTEIKNEQ